MQDTIGRILYENWDYSRRIGPNNGRAVPIVAGGRLTGRAGPMSIGVLNIQSGDDFWSFASPFVTCRSTSAGCWRALDEDE